MNRQNAYQERGADPAPIDRRLGRRIRALRKDRGLDAASFAARLHISEATLRALEAGAQRPSAAALLVIANTLGVPLLGLFAGSPRAARSRVLSQDGGPDEQELLDFLQACLGLRDEDFRKRLAQALAMAADD